MVSYHLAVHIFTILDHKSQMCFYWSSIHSIYCEVWCSLNILECACIVCYPLIENFPLELRDFILFLEDSNSDIAINAVISCRL